AADTEHHHGMMLDADGHQIIDLGDDFYTVGRPHPMIDPALRNQLIAGLGAQPQVRVLLVDVVIGFGATGFYWNVHEFYCRLSIVVYHQAKTAKG
ncbi:membrane protein FdrA, partial [Salmonella enterica subsp. enterica serovar Heidelberg str. 41573]